MARARARRGHGERRALERGAGAEQTCAAASPCSSGVVAVTGSASGTLTVWDAETGKVVRSYTFPCAIYDVVYPGGEAGKDAVVFVSASAREDGGGRVYRVSLSKGKIVERLGKTTRPCKLVASASGTFVACAERRTIYVWGTGKDRGGNGRERSDSSHQGGHRVGAVERRRNLSRGGFEREDRHVARIRSSGEAITERGARGGDRGERGRPAEHDVALALSRRRVFTLFRGRSAPCSRGVRRRCW